MTPRSTYSMALKHRGARHTPTVATYRWVSKHAATVPELVWRKCGSSGGIWTCDEDDKRKITLTLSPAALLVLKYRPKYPCFSVVTLYTMPDAVDGTHLGRYKPIGPSRRGPLPELELVARDRASEIRSAFAASTPREAELDADMPTEAGRPVTS